MAKEPKPATAAPDLPPGGPLLPVPKSRLAQRPQPVALVPGLAAPAPGARVARQNAVVARSGIERLVQQGNTLQKQLQAGLANHDTDTAASAEWQREGVDVTVVRNFASELEAFLKKFTATA